jgi:hypothetical protein
MHPPKMKTKLVSLAPGTPKVRAVINKLLAVLGRNSEAG